MTQVIWTARHEHFEVQVKLQVAIAKTLTTVQKLSKKYDFKISEMKCSKNYYENFCSV